MTQADRSIINVPCVTGIQTFIVESGYGAFKLRDTNGAMILWLELTREGFEIVPARGVKVSEAPR
jgi:hypothetical protein